MTDSGTYARNVIKHFPPEVQHLYFGRVLARSEDGTRILAHATDYDELVDDLERRGVTDYVLDGMLAYHVPLPDVTAPPVVP